MPRIAGLPPHDRVHVARRVWLVCPRTGTEQAQSGLEETPYRETNRLEVPDLNGAGRGGRTLTGLRPKVFEFYSGQAPTVTIGHVWSIFSNLDASTS